MFKFFCIVLLIMTTSWDCARSSNPDADRESGPLVKDDPPKFGSMRKIEMSFAASIAVKSDNGFLIIGNDGMALLDEKGDLGQFQKFKVVSQLHFDRNAGIRRDREPIRDPQLCSPTAGISAGITVVVFAQCDHSDEIWRVARTGEETRVDVISFPYWDEKKKNQTLLTAVSGSGGSIFLAGSQKNDPILLEVNPATWASRIVWRGDAKLGTIEKVMFIGARGYMLFSSGAFYRSTDKGETWDRSSPVFGEFAIGQTDMDFRNENEGAVLAKGVIYATKDGGTSWRKDESAIGDENGTVSLDSDLSLITTGNGGIAFKSSDSNDWTHQQVLPSMPIAFAAVQNRKLVVFSQGSLFYSALQDRR
ncbi:MAG: hypothetical protein IPK58_08510 [Acidobacteria bacterium]|nr:hypothetical protein [Acidobacteriota bacterium]